MTAQLTCRDTAVTNAVAVGVAPPGGQVRVLERTTAMTVRGCVQQRGSRQLAPAAIRGTQMHPGAVIGAYAAAALAVASVREATGLLDGLHGEGLLTETSHRRYGTGPTGRTGTLPSSGHGNCDHLTAIVVTSEAVPRQRRR
jgi:hypothetical protein